MDASLGETYLVSLSKMRQSLTPSSKTLNVSSIIKHDALTCKEWSTTEMIQCADEVVRKATSTYDCQLPMSIKIGDSIKYYIYYKKIIRCSFLYYTPFNIVH